MNIPKTMRPQPRQYPYFPLLALIHSTSAIIDAAVTVTLASSTLFALNVHDARFSILFSLIGTMLPFVLLAPTASLLVEKIKVPRILLTITLNGIRLIGLLLMALASGHSSTTRLAIFPLTFLMLTLSKCFVVAKTSTLPQITTVTSFPYFSSRLSMASGIISIAAGTLFLATNRLASEPFTLYLASLFVLFMICTSIISYFQIGKRVLAKEVDANIDGVPDSTLGMIEKTVSELSPRNQARAIKSLFTYASAIRFVVGIITIGIALKFRDDKFILGSCFVVAAVASFGMNAIAVKLNRTKFSGIINYFVVGTLVVACIFLIFESSSFMFICVSGLLGALSAYSRVIYESKAANVVPELYSAKIFARGEVWMQLLWVVGAVFAVVTYNPVVLGTLSAIALLLSGAAYASTLTSMNRSHERF